jgi:hypothetical protein
MTVTMRPNAGCVYHCVVSGIVGAKPWRGEVEVPAGVANDRSPEMYDDLAAAAALRAAAMFGEHLESLGSRCVVRRRWGP